MAFVIIVISSVYLWFWTAPALGHTLASDKAFLDWHWRPDVFLILIAFGAVYVRGWLKLRAMSARAVRIRQLTFYLFGLLGIVLALLSPIDALAEERLSMHMIQHLLLLMIAPLFLLLANPLPAFLWGFPRKVRLRLGRLLRRSSAVRSALWAITSLPVTWSIYVLNLWGWHHPALYQMALRNEWAHDLQHILFFSTALLFWWPIASPAPRLHGLISYGYRIVYLVAATLQNTLLGMALSIPERIIYPFYEDVPGLRDIAPIQDQALGGGIMWVSGHMYVVPVIILVACALFREEEQVRRYQTR